MLLHLPRVSMCMSLLFKSQLYRNIAFPCSKMIAENNAYHFTFVKYASGKSSELLFGFDFDNIL